MSGIANWKAQITLDIEDLKKKVKIVEGELGKVSEKEHKVKINIDTETLDNAIQKLNNMLDSLGKGTNDFKQLENLSKQLSTITSEVRNVSGAFGKLDDSSAKTLLSSVQNIDKSLTSLSEHIINVNKNMSNMGGNTSNAVTQIENVSKASNEAVKNTKELIETQNQINTISNKNSANSNLINTSGLKQQESQIKSNIDNYQKLLDLEYEVAHANKSIYDGKNNTDWRGYYKSQEEVIKSTIADNKESLNPKLNLLLKEDQSVLTKLESEANALKSSLEPVQEMVKRISSGSSISKLSNEKYAEEFQKIDTRLGELNAKYKLTNSEVEEYITLQSKASKIMNREISYYGGVKDSGASSKSQMRLWVQNSFARQLGYDDSSNYVFGNIIDSWYGKGHSPSLIDDFTGKQMSLRDLSANVLGYKALTSPFSDATGVKDDLEQFNKINGILNYINKNKEAINQSNFKSKIVSLENERNTAQKMGIKDLSYYDEKIQTLTNYQNRLESVQNSTSNTTSSVANQENIREELKQTEVQAEKTSQAIKQTSSTSSQNISVKTDASNVNTSTEAIKKENEALASTSESAQNAASAKEKFANANSQVKNSADTSVKSIKEEGNALKETAKSASTSIQNATFLPNTESFNDVINKFGILKSEAEQISKIVKTSKLNNSTGVYNVSYAASLKNGNSYTLGESSKPQVLNAKEVAFDSAVGERQKQIWNDLTNSLQRYSTISQRMASGKALSTDNQEAADLLNHIHELQRSDVLSAEKLNASNERLKKIDQTATDLKAKLKETTIDSVQGSIDTYSRVYEKFSTAKSPDLKSTDYTAKLGNLQNAITELDNYKKTLSGVTQITEEQRAKVEELEKNCVKAASALRNMDANSKGISNLSVDKILQRANKDLMENTKYSAQAKAGIKALMDQLNSGNPDINLKKILDDLIKIENQEIAAGRAGKSLWDIFKTKSTYGFIGQMQSYLSMYIGFYGMMRAIKSGVQTLKDFDDGLTKISYTMDLTKSQLDDMGDAVIDLANNLDSSIDDAMSVAQIYANMNTSTEEIKKLAQPTLALANLSGFDASTVADDIQAVTQQFDIAAEESDHIADVYDKISQNISVDYSKGIESIAQAVQVAGSTANQAGLSFEQLAAIVGKTVEKTRLEGSQVGNGLKTIMTRLSKVSELTDEVDNETLSKASKSLHKIGVEVYNSDGSYRQFDTIMGELSKKWDTLTDAQKSNISFNIAATRQTNLLSGILSNYSDSMDLATEATEANGNAMENNEKWVNSFSGRLQSLENTAKTTWLNILDSDTLKNGTSLLNNLLGVFAKLVDTIGVIPTLAGVLSLKNIGKYYVSA